MAAAALAALVAGCGGAVAPGGGPGPSGAGTAVQGPSGADVGAVGRRAAAVAQAWTGSERERVWRTGYVPVGVPREWLPPDAFHSAADKEAYGAGRLVLAGGLPRTLSGLAQVRWADGSELSLPLVSADEVFRGLTRAGEACADGCGPVLTVEGARPGTREVSTSRGRAVIPVWEFSVAGYGQPFVYPAVEGQGGVPAEPGPSAGPPGAVPVVWLGSSGDGRTLTGLVRHGSCSRVGRGEAYETASVVVLTVVVTGRTAGGACDAAVRATPVEFRLERPLGGRVVLDLRTGGPLVPQEGPAGP